MEDVERWAAVRGYEGLYEVSSHGRVRSLDRVILCRHGVRRRLRGLILSGRVHDGYRGVVLSKNDVDKTCKIARLVGVAFLGATADDEVDHWDRNRLNDRLSNLRLATRQLNACNMPVRASSGFKGVSLAGHRWRARVMVGKKEIHLGRFDTPEQAHAVYAEAARRLFGAFAHPDTPRAYSV